LSIVDIQECIISLAEIKESLYRCNISLHTENCICNNNLLPETLFAQQFFKVIQIFVSEYPCLCFAQPASVNNTCMVEFIAEYPGVFVCNGRYDACIC